MMVLLNWLMMSYQCEGPIPGGRGGRYEDCGIDEDLETPTYVIST